MVCVVLSVVCVVTGCDVVLMACVEVLASVVVKTVVTVFTSVLVSVVVTVVVLVSTTVIVTGSGEHPGLKAHRMSSITLRHIIFIRFTIILQFQV